MRDSGPGFDPQTLDRLFDAFYTTKPHGLGLGLAISRPIIEAHGGRLWATAMHPRRRRAVHGADGGRGGGLMDVEALVFVSAGARTRRHAASGAAAAARLTGQQARGPGATASGRAATGDEDEHLEMAVVITDLAEKSDK